VVSKSGVVFTFTGQTMLKVSLSKLSRLYRSWYCRLSWMACCHGFVTNTVLVNICYLF